MTLGGAPTPSGMLVWGNQALSSAGRCQRANPVRDLDRVRTVPSLPHLRVDPGEISRDDVRRVHLLVLRDLVHRIPIAPPEEFAKTAMLKPEDDYAPRYNSPHVNAACRLVAATGCAWPANTRFKYVQAQPDALITKSKKKASDYSMELESAWILLSYLNLPRTQPAHAAR